MNRSILVAVVAVILASAGVDLGMPASAQSSGSSDAPLRLAATVPLPNVSGRIDHLAYDARTQRLFIAALGNNTIEVVDTAKGTRLRSLPGFHEPQGVVVLSDSSAVAVANGDTGTLQLIDGDTLQTRWTKNVGGDADNVRYDPARRRLYVAVNGGIVVVDPTSGDTSRRIAVSGHPESFQLEQQSTAIYANVPDASEIVAANRQTLAVRARWPAGRCGSNYPMALDEAAHRVYVGCRRPASVAAYNTTDGRLVMSLDVVGDTDDLFYDKKRKQLYVIGGEGAVDVISLAGDTLHRNGRVPSRDGARTGLWVGEQDRLYVAVPARRGQSAEVRVFSPSR